ncbi:peptidase MA family metallohydrolase, partial [candidate division KSB1 bacterium]
FQQTNTIPNFLPEGVGGFFEFFKGRVVIPSDGSATSFKKVIRHELVHVFMHSKVYWVQKNQGKFHFKQPPLWFTEGIAEVWSSEGDSRSEMVMIDQVIENTLIPATKFSLISGSYLMYKEAESFLRYIEDTYGEEKLLLILENIIREKKFEDVIQYVLGKKLSDLNDEWVYHLKKKYYPVLETNDIIRMASKQITDEGFNEAPSFYYNNGEKHIAFVSNTSGYTNIVTMPYEKEKLKTRNLIKGERTSRFETIHFLKSTIDVNSEGILAFVTKSGEKDVLYLFDTMEKDVINSFVFDNIVSMSSPAWSNNNKLITFSAVNMSGHADIYILDVESGILTQHTDDFYEDLSPRWSLDDGSIVFSSDRSKFGKEGGYNIFIKNLFLDEIFKLTEGSHVDAAPTWSPDGEFVVFTSDRGGASNIYTMSMELVQADPMKIKKSNTELLLAKNDNTSMSGTYNPVSANMYIPGEIKKITSFVTGVFNPEVTPDGDIFFTSFEEYSYQIRQLKDAFKGYEEKTVITTSVIGDFESWTPGRISSIEGKNVKSYTKTYSLDIAQGQVSYDPIYSSISGAQIAISDILGNDQYYFLLYNTAQTMESLLRSFNFAIARTSLKKRTNFGYGVFHYSGRRYNLSDFYFNERYYGGFFGASYPISTFQRIEIDSNFGRSERDRLVDDQERVALLSGNFLTYVWDNSLWGPTGPMDGSRYLVSVGLTKDISFNNVNYSTVMVDLRKYFRVSNRQALAVRLSSYRNKGREARRFYIGGSWDLRGYGMWRIWGQHIDFVSAEYRFPFIDDIGIRFPFGGFGIRSLRGALYIDAAKVDDYEKEDIIFSSMEYPQKLGSVGGGLRFNFLGGVVFRLDIGRRFNGSLRNIEKSTYTKFFFGWDF